MGLLDEAIREHLDLRRRRGADPTEIERAEREALGPVRRNRDAPTPTGSEYPIVDRDVLPVGSAYDEPDEGIAADLVDEIDDAPAFDEDREPVVVRGSGEPYISGSEPFAEAHEPSDSDEPVDSEDDASATRLTHAADLPVSTDNTAEYDVEGLLAGEEDEDVLEETPEFLQETPDHDRLWFEQRPPRDFDFDG
jgi:hypothetical protein